MDLADYSQLFGDNKLFDELDKLPKPDVIFASPPCESWSNASAIKGGNICWQTETIYTLFGSYEMTSPFTLRDRGSFDKKFNDATMFKPNWWKTIYNRNNGELCAFNTIRIIERYEPEIWVIENPQSSKLWKYYKQIHSFDGIHNVAHYHYYDEEFPKKPTTFLSNVFLNLKTAQKKRPKVVIGIKGSQGRKIIRAYNERSNIPLPLIKVILEKCIVNLDGGDIYA